MPLPEHTEIMTLAEVSQYLKLSEKTLLKMVKNDEIPCAKIANQWRFVKSILDDWLLSQMRVIPQNDLSRLIETEYDIVPLSRLIDEKLILTDIHPGTKQEILERLVGCAAEHGLISDSKAMLRKLLEREQLASTAIGNGIAMPHLRRPNSSLVLGPKIVIGLCREGVDFRSIDNQSTYLFFLILSDSETVHLRVMSKLSSLLRDAGFVEQLVHTHKPAEIHAAIIEREKS